MVYLRGKRHYFDGLLRDGRRKQIATGTTSRALAKKMAEMWEALATEHRAWDLLGLVLDGTLPIGRLYDLWLSTRYHVAAIRRQVREVDLEPLVEQWREHYARRVKGDSVGHALAHVRSLLPEGVPCPAAAMDVARLTKFLATYPGKRNTVRKVHSNLSVFFDYATRIHGAYATNPMLEVDRPKAEAGPIRFYELDQVERIVGAQPDAARRAIFALLYGSGVEVSVALGLTRRDFDPARKEVRAAGTKALTRDRVARVADWAWPLVWEHVRSFTPEARPWGGMNRWTVSDWHRQTVGWDEETKVGLNLPVYPLKNARDHWAVRALRDGRAAVAEVQHQLGHGTPMLTLSKYGRFIPRTAERDAIEERAQAAEQRRKEAES